jgi:Ca2+-binding EF-hand superfamily protein
MSGRGKVAVNTGGKKVEPKKEEGFNPKKYEKNGLTEDEVLEIKEAFDLFDGDKSGEIDTEELKQALKNLGIDAKNQTLNNMMADLDADGSGQIDFEEFINMMTAKMSDRDTREDLQKVFRLFLGDDDKAERITFGHLKRVARELNENMTDDELKEMINRADLDHDSEVNFEEFYTIMTKKI